jgi:hypothetical protein
MVNSPGAHGAPSYSSPAQTLGDFQAASDYAAKVGNRVIVDSDAEMTSGFGAKFGFGPWDGLECFNTASGETHVFNANTGGWDDPSPLTTYSDGIFTASSGWSTSGGSQKLILVGGHLAAYYFSFKRTGGNLPAGNFENVTVGRVSLPPAGGSQPFGPGYSGAAQFMVDTTGLVQLTSSNDAISTGDLISGAGVIII